jgi:3-hydroxybutyryl-CoA dehydratase
VTELWTPGQELPRLERTMTAQRMRWYADALELVSVAGTEPIIAPLNIHTDDDLARDNGLPARVADGMVSTNWISSLLAGTFGDAYLEGGSLRTRYVRPIFEDDRIEVVVRVTGREAAEDGSERLVLDVACLGSEGQVVTGGTATVRDPG